MGRLLAIWRSWSVRRRAITVLVAAVAAGGLGVLAYELLKRPPDVINENVDFASREQPKPKQKRPKDTTFDWPTYGFNDARTRYVPSDKVKPPFDQSDWSFQAGKLLEFSPIIVGERIYFMDIDARFYALNTPEGKVAWQDRIGQLNASAPAYSQPPAVRRQPRARAGVRPSAPRRQDALEDPPPRPERVLAARVQGRARDLRLRVRHRVRPRPEERLDRVDGRDRRRDQGCARAGWGQRLRRQLRGRVLLDRRRVRERRVEDQHDRRVVRPRRRHLLDAGGGVRPRVLREHRLARLQPGHGHGRDRVVEVHGRRGLFGPRGRRHRLDPRHRLHRLDRQQLLRSRRPYGCDPLAAGCRRPGLRRRQRHRRRRLRLGDRGGDRDDRLRHRERQAGLRARARGVQPRDHGRRTPVPDRLFEPPSLPARGRQEGGLEEEGRREETGDEVEEEAEKQKTASGKAESRRTARGGPALPRSGGAPWPRGPCACRSGRSTRPGRRWRRPRGFPPTGARARRRRPTR